MKKTLLFFFVFLFWISAVYAYSFSAVASTGQMLYYNISGSNVTVTHPLNSSPYYSDYPTGTLVIPSNVTYNGHTYTVTSIGYAAFDGCSGLTSVTIPNSVTSIEWYAFKGCTSLTSVTIPNSVTGIGESAFEDCSGLTSVTIGNSVTYIGDNAFSGCSGLTSITIPNSVTGIGKYVFANCSGLTSVTIGNSVTSIGHSTFLNCIGITTLTFNATNCTTTGNTSQPIFYGCTNLATVIIGANVTTIPENAFSGCNGLTSVTIPNSVTSIGNYAFRNCSSLTSVTIPNSVTGIGVGAFYGCSGLTSVTIPYSVTIIGAAAFAYCSGLTSISVDAQNHYYYSDNYNAIIEFATTFTLIAGCQNTIIPYSVTSIGNYAFSGCTGLTSITIPNWVTSIGNYTFSDCTGLTSITIPDSVTSIGNNAFSGCTGLTSITIPNSVTSIGNNAFSGCSSLTTLNYDSRSCSGGGFSQNEYSHWLSRCSTLTTLNIGNNVRVIPAYAFRYCNGLTTLNYNADSCMSVPSYWLSGCTSLTTVNIGNNVRFIPNYFTSGWSGLTSVTIPNSVTYIGNDAFDNCCGLTSVTIPNSVTSIEDYAFSRCTGLTSVTIGNSVTSIGVGVFYGCTGLTSVSIGNSVTSIGGGAFYDCSGLVSVTIPNSVTSIGGGAFSRCTGLTSVTIPNSVTSIGGSAFYGCSGLSTIYFNADSCTYMGDSTYSVFGGCINFSTVNIGNNVRIIPNTAFYGCSGLTSLTIPNSVTSIGCDAFGNCTGLTSVTIGNSVTSIGGYAFYGCTGLDSVTIPNSVTSIGDGAFYDCSGLAVARMHPNTPPTLGSESFGNTPSDLEIIIPCGSLEAYQQTWGTSYHFNDSIDISVTLLVNESEGGSVAIQQQNGHDIGCDSTCIIVATANYGYHFSHWSNGSGANPETIDLLGDSTVTAYFERNTYTLSAQLNNTSIGTISFPQGSTALYGDTLKVVITPNEHHHVYRWNGNDIVATSERKDTVWVRMMDNCNVTAYVAIDTHTVSVASSDIARGNVTASGSEFAYGTPCTVEATAYTGYTFAGWSNGVAANPYIFAVMSDVELTALFVTEGEETYTVTVESADLSMGTVSGGGSTLSGGEVTIRATANPGYQFDHWNDGNTENPRTVTVNADATYTAYFVSTQGIEDADALSQLTVYPNPTTGLLHIKAEKVDKVEVLDLVGRRVALFENTATLDLSKLAEGTYTLKVTLPDGVAIRKVVKK